MPEGRIFSRRRFMGLCLGAAGAAITGGSAALLWLRGRAPETVGLRCLSSHEYRTLARLAASLFPRGGPFPVGAEDLDLARRVDAYLADEPPWRRRDLKRALLLLEMVPVVRGGRGVTFSHLDEGTRLRLFQSWAEGDRLLLRQIALGLGKLLSLLFYDDPSVWPHIGYDGPVAGAA